MRILLLLLLLSVKMHANQGTWVYNPPYYAQYGYMQRHNDLEIYAPYIGVGLMKTQFSSGFVAQTGVALYYKQLSWKLEYVQGFIPDMSLFDFKNIEYYGQNQFIVDFNNFRVSSLTKFGNMLYASQDSLTRELDPYTYFGVKQIFSLDSQLYNNNFIIMTSMINIGVEYVPAIQQSSYYIKNVNPITFDFIHSKLGFMTTIFYSDYISQNRSLVIGENYSGYDEAIDISIRKPEGLYKNFYHLTGAVDFIYRVYMGFIPDHGDRTYVAFGGNVGFGYHVSNKTTDLLYIGTVAIGYEYEDTVPFEIRFTIDQDGNLFFNMSVVSPIAHRFDSNLD